MDAFERGGGPNRSSTAGANAVTSSFRRLQNCAYLTAVGASATPHQHCFVVVAGTGTALLMLDRGCAHTVVVLRDALEGKGPQRRPQKRFGRRLEEVAKAVEGGYCWLQMPLSLALGARETVAGHRLGALEGGGAGGRVPPPLPMHHWSSSTTSIFLLPKVWDSGRRSGAWT